MQTKGDANEAADPWKAQLQGDTAYQVRAVIPELGHLIQALRAPVLTQVLLDLEASVSIGAPAHLWGEPATMREMELRALDEHETLVDAIADGRADDADALARAHVAIDFEHISAAMRRAGVLSD